MYRFFCGIYSFVGWFGKFTPQLLFRLLVAWHFWDSGLSKFHKHVTTVPEQNLAPFAMAGDEASFFVIMWLELAAAVLILFGFATRIAAFGLLVLIAATFMSYLPLEYNSLVEFWRNVDTQIPAFKFNLALLLILLSLFLSGPGGISLDALFKLSYCPRKSRAAEKSMQTARKAEKEAQQAEKDAKQAEKDAKHAEQEAKKASDQASKAEERAKESEKKSKELEAKLSKVEEKLDKAEQEAKDT